MNWTRRGKVAIKLIINADDFGLTLGVSQGIAEGMRHTVTSTTIMGNCPGLHTHLDLLRGLSHRGFGAHLVLSSGVPVLPTQKVPSLVDSSGRFPRDFRMASTRAEPNEVLLEWRAQIENILRNGIKLTHLDSHHHVHLVPKLVGVARQLAEEFNIPAIRRLTLGDVFREGAIWRNVAFLPTVAISAAYLARSGLSYPGRLMSLAERNIVALESLPSGIYEIFCHPGYVDSELHSKSSLLYERENELRLLSSPAFAEGLEKKGIQLVHYGVFRG